MSKNAEARNIIEQTADPEAASPSEESSQGPTLEDTSTQENETPTQTETGNREAAKYRKQLRATEDERDNLATKLEALQRQTVEQIATELRITNTESLWLTGLNLEELTNEDGTIDRELTTQTLTTHADTYGLHINPGTPKPDPTQGGTGKPISTDRWTAAMRR